MNRGIVVALLALAPCVVFAQNDGASNTGSPNTAFGTFNPQLIGVHRGTKEITLAGSGSASHGFSNGNFGASFGYGWYTSQDLEVAVRQDVNFVNLNHAGAWNGSTRAALDYHWTGGRWRPFAGGEIGAIYGDGVNDTGILGPEVGIKYYIKPDTFFYFREEYQVLFDSSDNNNDTFSNGTFVHTVGIGMNY